MNLTGPYRTVTAEAVIPAKPDEVWQAWTTEAGLRTFFAPHVEMDLRIGGPFHILFDLDAPAGLRGADDMRIMAFEHGKMLAFDWNAPPELPDIRPQRTHVTVYFEATCSGGTRVTLIHDGWGTSESWDAAYAYFDSAWGDVVLPRLRWRFENGPVDWNNRPDFSIQALKGRLLTTFDQEQRIAPVYRGVERSQSGRLIRSFVPFEQRGFIGYSRLPEQGLDQVIAEQVEYFSSKNAPFEWKAYDHDTPASLKDRLTAAGFVPDEPEALMVMDIESAPAGFFETSGLDIRRIEDVELLHDVQAVEEGVYGTSWQQLLAHLRKDFLETPEIVSVYTGYDQGRPVSCAWTYFHPGTHFASFWGGSTLPDYRSRGYYTAMLAARAAEARQRDYRYLRVDASPMSKPILEKHGFLFLINGTPFNWSPPATS